MGRDSRVELSSLCLFSPQEMLEEIYDFLYSYNPVNNLCLSIRVFSHLKETLMI